MSTELARPRRAQFREHATAEALAFDRRLLPIDPRPGAFGWFFDCPSPIRFLDFEGRPLPDALTPEGIAVLRVNGPLEHKESWLWNSYHDLQREMEVALAWPMTQKLVLKIGSPGGVCEGMLACHRQIQRLRTQYKKPIVAFGDEMIASAAYGIASACDEIWIPAEGEAGSIGVILGIVDEAERLKKDGVSVTYLVTGKRKADLHPGSKITSEVLRVAQTKVDELGAQFFAATAKARGTTPKAIAALEAAVFRGKNAVSAGLADGVADWPEFLSYLRAA